MPAIDCFAAWVAAYGRAWETHDAALISRLFAEDALYFIKPFDEPLRGRAAIIEYWQGIAQTQAKVRFSHEVLAVTERGGLAHWSVTFQR
ncbi:MAG TPA: nuclear transport factor 2 family protein, partial [Phototrophicaceae bacterium]|nr:nuclear transport factor 2 family protein [Phototrophicaceae bacterium]